MLKSYRDLLTKHRDSNEAHDLREIRKTGSVSTEAQHRSSEKGAVTVPGNLGRLVLQRAPRTVGSD